jgi:hypothetical protein
MSECGLFAQFIPTTHPPESLRLILRTFIEVFPEAEIFLDAPSSIMLVGSRCPVGGRDRPTRDELKKAKVLREIEGIFVKDATSLPALWVSSGRELVEVLGDGPLNSWDQLLLEFWSIRLPPFERSVLAESMRLVSDPRAANPKGDWPYSALPEYETIQLINEAIMRSDEPGRAGVQALLEEIDRRMRDWAPSYSVREPGHAIPRADAVDRCIGGHDVVMALPVPGNSDRSHMVGPT